MNNQSMKSGGRLNLLHVLSKQIFREVCPEADLQLANAPFENVVHDSDLDIIFWTIDNLEGQSLKQQNQKKRTAGIAAKNFQSDVLNFG
jgi:hypothetical protein